MSSSIFCRSGKVAQIDVHINADELIKD